MGFFEFIIQREGEKPQTRGTFMGHHKKTTQGVGHSTTLSGITDYFSFLWCKNIYPLHKIPSYSKSKAKKFESIFPLGSIFIYIIDFFVNLQMTTE